MRGRREQDASYLYRVLSHPIRRRIIELLGERGRLGFKELNSYLDVRVGTLYYHFDILKDFITQDRERKYMLTPLGREAHSLISDAERQPATVRALSQLPTPTTSVIRAILLPRGFFYKLYLKPRTAALGALGILLFGSFIVGEAELEPLVLFLRLTRKPTLIIYLEFLLGVVALFAVSDILSTIFFKRRGGDIHLLIGTVYALLPLIIFPSIWYLDTLLDLALFGPELHLPVRLLLPLLQGWTLSLLSCAISLSKSLTMEKAALIGFLTAFANTALIYALLLPT